MRTRKSKIPIKERTSEQEFNDQVKQYTHEDKKRYNNPPVGLVTAETDHLNGKKNYEYDLHLDPQLQWAGKKEEQSFDVDTVSLHVHERIDPLTIIETCKKKEQAAQIQLFHYFEQDVRPIREAIEFYKHEQNWSNRLIAGDSLIMMNSLLEKEGMAGKVQMIYIDPPYGITYGSNFQPFVNKREVKDKDEDLTQEPETIKAFRDTWELGIHSYLSYLRDRLRLSKELLTESGSCFVQISDQNLHHVREIMDEVFGSDNFIITIPFKKKGSQKSSLIDPVNDYLVWYTKSKRSSNVVKFRKLFVGRDEKDLEGFSGIILPNGEEIEFNELKTPDGKKYQYNKNIARLFKDYPDAELFRADPLTSGGTFKNQSLPFEFQGRLFKPGKNTSWKTTVQTDDNRKPGMHVLKESNRLYVKGTGLYYKRKLSDFPYKEFSNWWDGLGGASNMKYVVQTNEKVVKRCILMTTDPGDLVLDPTCGSGTTAYVAEQWGRRWITCDTSRVSITLAKQRLMTAIYDYYELLRQNDGVKSGFKYKTVPHVTLGSIANNEPKKEETLYDQPIIDKKRKRVSGPFTLEAAPSQSVTSFEEVENLSEADVTIARSGETIRQNDWMDEMLVTGVRGKAGQRIEFSRIEALGGTRYVHAEGETKNGEKTVISFGPKYASLEQRQVELAIQEAQKLVPKPKIVIFASFQFDPEAAKDIEELKWPGVTSLKVQMNTDLLTSDLKKKRSSNDSFWLMGQPDVEVIKQKDQFVVQVNGFDYYNSRTGEIESGDTSKIAMWELDTDYDGRSLYPRQVFFPMAGKNDGWDRLAKTIRAVIDEELIEQYKKESSIPFKLGENKRVAVKIIDDRGIESLKIIDVKE